MKGQLALLKRAILTDSRSIGNYLSALAGGIVFFLFFLEIGESGNFTGLSYLQFISFTNLFIITLTGVVGFSSAITEEKEENTLGLLLMSGITPATLIFSKAISRTIRGLLLTLSQLPFVIIAIALGGISINQVVALYVCFISFIIFLAFFCAFFSVLCATTTQAAFISGFILILALIFTVNVDASAIYLNPVATIDEVLSIGFDKYWIIEQVITHFCIAVFFYFLSVQTFKTMESQPTPVESTTRKATTIGSKKNSRVWIQALCWKDFNYNYGGPLWWLWQTIIVLGISMTLLSGTRNISFEDFSNVTMTIGAVAFFLQLTFVAQNIMSREFKNLTHTALFTLPSETRTILNQKLMAGLLFTLPSLILTLIGSLKLISSEREALWVIMLMTAAAGFHLILTFYLSIKIRLFAFILAAFGTMLYSFFCGLILSKAGEWETVSILMTMFYTGAAFLIFTLAFNLLQEKASQN